MGCASAKKQPPHFTQNLPNPSGLLKITVMNAVLFHQASLFKMDPYVRLELSNQKYETKVDYNGGKNPSFNETFTFYINSVNKQYGRTIQMILMDKNKLSSDNIVGHGIVDINPVITQKKIKDEFRCMLTHNHKQAGFVNIIAQFIEQPEQILHFRFQEAKFYETVGTFGGMNVLLEVTVGQEVIKTKKCKGSKQKLCSWAKQTLTFRVFPLIKDVKIKIFDDAIELGEVTVNLQNILNSFENQQNFTFNFGNIKGKPFGALKFKTIKGKAPSFASPSIPSKPPQFEQPLEVQNQPQISHFQPYFQTQHLMDPYNQKQKATPGYLKQGERLPSLFVE